MIQWNNIPTYIPTTNFFGSTQSYSMPLFGFIQFGAITTQLPNYSNIVPTPQGIQTYTNNFTNGFNFQMPNFMNFQLPTINFPTFNFSNIYNGITNTARTVYNGAKKAISTVAASVGSTASSIVGYCAESGRKLAQAALDGSAGKFIGYCAKYVKTAIKKVFPSIDYKYGVNGCDMADAYKATGKFKEISAQGVDLKKLPAGCILCYGKGVAGYNSQYGHTEITLGNGKAVSDGITRNIRPGARILIPIA